MKMSDGARHALIEAFEGFRALAYRDSVGVLTIGYGHTSAIGPPRVVDGLRIDQRDADAILAKDLARVEAGVAALLRATPTQNEFDALVDFAYNVGLGALRSSTLLRRFNAGDAAGASDCFSMWAKAGGRVIAGLERRRLADRAWFLGLEAVAPDASCPVHRIDSPDAFARRILNRIALRRRFS